MIILPLSNADRACDTDDRRRFIVKQRGEPVIPGWRNRTVPIDHDRERDIGGARQYRRLATRFEKTASLYPGS